MEIRVILDFFGLSALCLDTMPLCFDLPSEGARPFVPPVPVQH